MNPHLDPALTRHELSANEIRAAASALLDGNISDGEKADFLRAWAQRGETAAELAACAEAFLPGALIPGVSGTWNGRPLLDCCGTGGGGLNLLNISTGLMFVLAALEIPVVKHGNRGLTKKSGSADVLEALGLRIDLPPEKVSECLEKVGCAFLFAPAYHPAFAAVSGVRRQLGVQGQRTIFNLLGPLLNPARPDARLVGVFKEEHVALYQQALLAMNCPRFSVVCGEDRATRKKIGEASADGTTLMRSSLSSTSVRSDRRFTKSNSNFELMLVSDAAESARRLTAILKGDEHGLARETLLLNAALGSWTHGTASSLEEGLAQGTEAVDSGRAFAVLERWRKFFGG